MKLRLTMLRNSIVGENVLGAEDSDGKEIVTILQKADKERSEMNGQQKERILKAKNRA